MSSTEGDVAPLPPQSDADELIDQLNVVCEDFGCEAGSDRLFWLHDQLTELSRLRTENEALREALQDLTIFYGDDSEAREVLRSDFTGPEPLLMDDDALRESVWINAERALSKALGEGHSDNG